MKKVIVLLLLSTIIILPGCTSSNQESIKNEEEISKSIDNMVFVEGGEFKNTNSRYTKSKKSVADFYIGKYEVTQKEWKEVMGDNPSKFIDEDKPVEMVSWYDSIEYCNKRSEKEGLEPYYNIDKSKLDNKNNCEYDDVKWIVTVNEEADGYRLPTEEEWEYAAEGGIKTQNFLYSGSSNIEDTAWYWRNAGDKRLEGDWIWSKIENNNNDTKTVGAKSSNELGLYDMSGNVREWCYDWYKDSSNPPNFYRVWKGGGLIGEEKSCEVRYRGKFEPNGTGNDQGLRLCKNS